MQFFKYTVYLLQYISQCIGEMYATWPLTVWNSTHRNNLLQHFCLPKLSSCLLYFKMRQWALPLTDIGLSLDALVRNHSNKLLDPLLILHVSDINAESLSSGPKLI